jgi:hypothetical protein
MAWGCGLVSVEILHATFLLISSQVFEPSRLIIVASKRLKIPAIGLV